MARNNENTRVYKMLELMDVEGTPLRGKRICITGHLAQPRKKIEELIRSAGGIVDSNVGYGTTFLVSNEDWTAETAGKKSSKQMKAEKLGVKVIREERLLRLMSGDDKPG